MSDRDDNDISSKRLAVPDRDIESQSNGGSSKVVTPVRTLYKIIFIMTGCFELFYWNNILSILYNIRRDVYPDYPSMTDTLNAANNLVQGLVCLYMVYTGAMNPRWVVFAGCAIIILTLTTSATVQWIGGLPGVLIIHLISGTCGGLTGVFQAGAYGLASSLPKSLSGYVSTGDGLCGVLSFALWMIVSSTSLSTKGGCWVLMTVSALFGVGSISAYIHLVKKPDVAERVRDLQARLKNEATDPNAPSYFSLFKQAWVHITCMWLNFFITLFIFPNIGPLDWNDGDSTNFVLGAFQVGDLIGRYSPNLLIKNYVGPGKTMGLVGIRLVFVPLALLIWHFQNNSFWNAIWLHVVIMLFLGITNGMTASVILMNGPRTIKEEPWRARASSMVVLSLQLGIATGLWTARLFTALTN